MSMKRLAELSAAARAAGMTYGQYMALQSVVPPPPKRRIPDYIRSNVKCCAVCGEPLVGYHKACKYCNTCRPLETARIKAVSDKRRRAARAGEVSE